MDQSKLMELQLQMKQNNADLQSYLTGLDSWVDEVKDKEQHVPVAETPKLKEDNVKLPPVRNSLAKKKKKKKPKVKEDEEVKPKKTPRIRGFDFKGWDKYDVDKAVAEIDADAEKTSSSSEYETDEEAEAERRVQQANDFKEQGNIAFKEGNYNKAIEFYTYGVQQDPTNGILPANRAMALIKQEKFGAAEVDCTTSIALDPTYVKAYSRRGTARVGLQHYEEANRDFDKVLALEPNNKFAQAEKKKLKEKLKPVEKTEINEDTGVVRAVYKPAAKRSKKPLRRIKIEEIGGEDGQTIREAIAKTEATQGDAKRRVTQQDSKMFEQFTSAEASVATSKVTPISQDLPDEESRVTDSESSKKVEPAGDSQPTFSSPAHIGSKTVPPGGSTKTRPATSSQREVGEAVTSPTLSPRLPDVPTSSFQFQADWKVLKKHPEKFYQYFKRILPGEYVKLIGQALDADIVTAVLAILRDFYMLSKEDMLPVLHNLACVKRFSMTIMFMSANDKTVLKALFEDMKTSALHDSNEIDKLAKKYGL